MDWEEKRQLAIKEGVYRPSEPNRIRLKLTKKEIEKILSDKETYKELNDIERVITHLKSEVYLNRVKNEKHDLHETIFQYEASLREMFTKKFWEEYIYEHNCWNTEDIKELEKRTKNLNKIKDYLFKNSKYEGIAGDTYQQGELWKIIKELTGWTFSMRSWGALMAAYMNSKKGKRLYDYMDFYMDGYGSYFEEEK